MTYKQMREKLDEYNWDNGFDIPQKIISDENCDLAMALEIFYLGNGFEYFDTDDSYSLGEDWHSFISNLYENIKNGKYKKSQHHYQIPLTKTQRNMAEKNNIPNIFLNDV